VKSSLGIPHELVFSSLVFDTVATALSDISSAEPHSERERER